MQDKNTMPLAVLLQAIEDCCNDITFTVDGVKCGIFPSVSKGLKEYHVWYGSESRTLYSSFDVIDSDVFGGRPLRESYNKIQFNYS